MCGISVVLDPEGTPDTPRLLARMHAAIPHRGPDGEGALVVERGAGVLRATDHASPGAMPAVPGAVCAVAFRRLRIVDLSKAADQPMTTPERDLWIAFNGEIYNHHALRRELAADGLTFRTRSDTEVVLQGFRRWGTEVFARLEGMWAVVLLDLARGRLVACRDRFGVKPLLMARRGRALLLASEAKQILAAGPLPPNAHLVGRYLRGERFPCLDETFFEGITPLRPATWCELSLCDPTVELVPRAYWSLPAPRADPPSYADAVAELRSLLEQSSREQAAADAPVGSLVSGGIDSTGIVLGLGDAIRGGALPTFSISFPGPHSELPYIEAIVEQERLDNRRTTFDAGWLLTNLPRAIRALEEPPLALPAIAQYRVFELVRAHGVTVVLDGQGADEILGGYPYHQRTHLRDLLSGAHLGTFAREVAAMSPEYGGTSAVLRSLVGVLRPPRFPWLSRPFRRATAWPAPDESCAPTRLGRELYFDVRWGNVPIVLGYGDRNAMAHSVESRVPYFSRPLVELAFSLPDHYKVSGGLRKRILRDALGARLPARIRERRGRTGFQTPDETLLAGPMRAHLRGTILSRAVLESRWIDAAALRRHVEAQDRAGGDLRSLWRIYALAVWATCFDVSLA